MRITGGLFRSRHLVAPKGDRTRPTSDRVREALFASLVAEEPVTGVRVLDLYAGTGALALEALSRGADHATLVESGREALAAIRANAEALGCTARVRVVAQPVERARERLSGPFDLVFIDPPYADVPSGALVRSLGTMFSAGDTLAEGGRVVVEHDRRDALPALEGLTLRRSRAYGDTVVSIFESA